MSDAWGRDASFPEMVAIGCEVGDASFQGVVELGRVTGHFRRWWMARRQGGGEAAARRQQGCDEAAVRQRGGKAAAGRRSRAERRGKPFPNSIYPSNCRGAEIFYRSYKTTKTYVEYI